MPNQKQKLQRILRTGNPERFSLFRILAACPAIAFVTFSSCDRQEIRTGIPVIFGIRVDEKTSVGSFDSTLQWMKSNQYNRLSIEFPMDRDSATGMLLVPQVYLEKGRWINEKLSGTEIRVSIGVYIYNAERFNNRKSGTEDRDLDDYMEGLKVISSTMDTRILERVVCGCLPGEFTVSKPGLEFERKLSKIRTSNRTKIAWCCLADKLHEFTGWDQFDEIAISYPPAPSEEQFSYNRSWNSGVSAQAVTFGLPVIIWHSNVIGDYKPEQLRNHLRFWPENVVISAVNLNSIYNIISPLDENPYFGSAGNQDFLNLVGEISDRNQTIEK